MKIAAAIMIVALVARAQGIVCYTCGDVVILGAVSEHAPKCTSETITECAPELDGCMSLFMTWTTIVNGTTMKDRMYAHDCGDLADDTKEKHIAGCAGMQSDMNATYHEQGFDKFECRIELCQDDLCNSDTRVSYLTSLFLVGVFLLFI